MNSTSISDPSLILKVEDLGLTFNTHIYQGKSLRDYFVELAANPIRVLRQEAEKILLFQGLNFEVKRGERIGIVGLNGVGKTSLCRCISGHYNPTKGNIERFGIVRAIFDTAIGIQPELTGRENAYLLGAFMYPEHIDHLKDFVEEALAFSELNEFLDAPFRIYSNGMQARLCLSLISSVPADLLILDEVFEGADHVFRNKISERILKMIESSGAVLFVSHSPGQIERVCNRVLVLDQGAIVFDGPPIEGQKFYESLGSPTERFKTFSKI